MNFIEARIVDRVLFVTIRRGAKLNTLSMGVLAELRDTFERYSDDAALVGAVLTGEGDRAFAAGGDLHEFDAARTRPAAEKLARLATDALEAVRRFPVPVVAALNGAALGGGAELAAACDLRVFAAHARIGFIQGSLGISTGWGGGDDLRRIVGGHAALRILIGAQKLDAQAAFAAGLADAVAEEGKLDEAVTAVLSPLRARSPQVLRAFKAVTRPPREKDVVEREYNHFLECWLHDDHWKAHDAIVASLGAKRQK